jgi:hypothetical protein
MCEHQRGDEQHRADTKDRACVHGVLCVALRALARLRIGTGYPLWPQPLAHSCRSASIGLRRAARRAG